MPAALDILQQTFGYPSFRGPQETIIQTIVEGNDALVLMPTGGGKSLCYQIPALVKPGCGVVISPLIALMQDQVNAMRELGVRASFLNSTLDATTAAEVERALIEGELDLLYIAPERLTQSRTLDLLKRCEIALFAIDEAHCVSQWGHDFRADYLQLSLLHEQFPDVPRIALTATADEQTRLEIAARLQLEDAARFVVGFDRPNIRYRIGLKHNARQQLLAFLKAEHPNDAGIVYCLSRKKTEETASWLATQGFTALPYHAGLPAEERAAHQARFPEHIDPRVLVAGLLRPGQVLGVGLLAALGVLVLSALMASYQRPFVPYLGLAGLVVFAAYSFAPLRLNYRGGGEILEVVGVGILLPLTGYYIAAGSLPTDNGHLLVPLALYALVGALASGLKHEPADRENCKRTCCVLFGAQVTKKVIWLAQMVGRVWCGLFFIAGDYGHFALVLGALLPSAPMFVTRRFDADADCNNLPALARYKQSLVQAGYLTSVALMLDFIF